MSYLMSDRFAHPKQTFKKKSFVIDKKKSVEDNLLKQCTDSKILLPLYKICTNVRIEVMS